MVSFLRALAVGPLNGPVAAPDNVVVEATAAASLDADCRNRASVSAGRVLAIAGFHCRARGIQRKELSEGTRGGEKKTSFEDNDDDEDDKEYAAGPRASCSLSAAELAASVSATISTQDCASKISSLSRSDSSRSGFDASRTAARAHGTDDEEEEEEESEGSALSLASYSPRYGLRDDNGLAVL